MRRTSGQKRFDDLGSIDVKKRFLFLPRFLRFKRFFYFAQRFLFEKNVHWKSHQKLREALLGLQKRINRS